MWELAPQSRETGGLCVEWTTPWSPVLGNDTVGVLGMAAIWLLASLVPQELAWNLDLQRAEPCDLLEDPCGDSDLKDTPPLPAEG